MRLIGIICFCMALLMGSADCAKKRIPEYHAIAGSSEAPSLYDRPGPFVVHTRDFPELKDPARNNRSVPVKVHYPENGEGFPLVVFSHGGGGNRDSNKSQAAHIASHGYVVLCAEHIYSNSAIVRYYMGKSGGRMSFMDALQRMTTDPRTVLQRPKDISFAIDRAIEWNKSDPALRGKISTGKIIVAGHSFGAYTTLVVCGAQPILDYLKPGVPPGKGLAGDLSDSRVTAGIAMSPQSPGGTFFNNDSYATIHRPLLCLTGSKDDQKSFDGGIMHAKTRMEAWKLIPAGDKYLLWLENADHLGFSYDPDARIQLPSESREDCQRISKAMMVIFCDYYGKGRKEAKKLLNGNYANTLCGRVVTHITWYEK